MRTISQLAAYYRANDENTAVTTHFLRQKILAGEIPFIKAGSKRLISIEAVDAFLAGAAAPTEPDSQRCAVRPIALAGERERRGSR
jgi:excisionase family DNA binding protein